MKKILIIEDDLTILQLIRDFLETEGFEVYWTCSGLEGINIAKKMIPQLIICDVMMPGLNGYEVLENLQKDEKTAAIPFIFLSAKVERQDIRQGMNLGADDYLTKPFKLDELLKAIDSRLRKKQIMSSSSPLKEETEPVSAETESKQKLTEDGHIFVLVKNQPVFIKISQIECICAEAEYTYVYTTTGEKYLVRKLLKHWEDILPEKSFIRIHRSTIINLNYVEKVEKWFNNSYNVRLKDIKETFVISRRYASLLKSKLHYK